WTRAKVSCNAGNRAMRSRVAGSGLLACPSSVSSSPAACSPMLRASSVSSARPGLWVTTLTSTAVTKRLPEQRLANEQRQLVEGGLVVSELPVLLEELRRGGFQLDHFAREPDQLLAKREAVEIRREQRFERLSRGRGIAAAGRGRQSEALVQGVDLAGHGGERRYAGAVVRVDLRFYACALRGVFGREKP